MEASCSDQIAERLPFPVSEEGLHKTEGQGVQSVADFSSDMTTRSVNLSSDLLDSSGNSDVGLGMSIPLSIPRKLQQDDCHRANQISATPIMATPASNQMRNRLFYTADWEIKSTDKKGQERTEAAERLLFKDNHLTYILKLLPNPDSDLSIPIFPESSLKRVEIERMLYPPYMPFGCDGPQITMSTAIDLLNWYYASLSCDRIRLRPEWREDVIRPEKADPIWLENLYCKIKPMTSFKRLYRLRLFLPPNSPLRE